MHSFIKKILLLTVFAFLIDLSCCIYKKINIEALNEKSFSSILINRAVNSQKQSSNKRVWFSFPNHSVHMAEQMMVKNMQYVLNKKGYDSYIFSADYNENFYKIFRAHCAQRIIHFFLKPSFQLIILNTAENIYSFPTYLFVNQYGACSVLPKINGVFNVNEDYGWINEKMQVCFGESEKKLPVDFLMPSLSEDYALSPDGVQYLHLYSVLRTHSVKTNKYTEMCKIIQQTNLLRLYGANPGPVFDKSYQKMLRTPSDIVKEINGCGISLVLHSDYHLAHAFTSSRLFESIAAGAAIICDMNPFVMKEFGDSIFYFDNNASIEEMAKQIIQHVAWIQAHPDEVREKVRRTQAIWKQSYSAERFIDNMLDLHSKALKDVLS